MHQKKLLALPTAILILGFLSACKSEEQPPPQYPPQQQQPYGAQPYGAAPYGAQPAQPQAYPTAPAPAPAPAPAATPAAQMSQPSPMAFACQSDAQCLTHRCNTQFGKCAWPCQSDADCVTGNRCQAGACIPSQ